jgi:hypothetical protein
MLSAAKWGAIVGVAIYLVAQAITFISQATLGAAPADPAHPGILALGCIELLLIVFAFSASGFYAGRETRVAWHGTIAGMVTFAVYDLLLALIPVGAHVTLSSGVASGNQQAIVSIVSIALYLGLAALIGWLGGRPGATRGKALARRAEAASDSPS